MKRIPIDLKFELIEYNNSGFSKGKCYVCYHGENRNGSFLAKEDIEKALPSIFGIPVVGEYLFDIKNEINTDIKGNYTDHEGIVMRPSPIGFIPNDAKCYWEFQSDKEYLVVEGIILWTKRYPEAKNVFDRQFNQSMEIGLNDEDSGYYDEKDKLYHITDFSFEALTVLGTDCIRNEDGSVSYRGSADCEPCFEDSRFDTYTMKTDFRKEYELMLKEFKKFNMKKGGKNMDEKIELLKKYSHLKEEKIAELKGNLENYSLEELEIKLKEVETLEFTLSNNQISCAINKALDTRKIIAKDYWGEAYETTEFYKLDFITEDKIVIVMDYNWENCYGIPYTMSGDIATLDFDKKVAYMRGDWRPVVGGESVLDINFSNIKSLYEKKIETYINKAIEKTKAEFNVKETEEYKALNTELGELQEKYSEIEGSPDEKLQLEYNTLQGDFTKAKEDYDKLQGEFTTLETEKNILQTNFEALTTDKETIQAQLNSYKLKEKESQVNELFSKEEFSCLSETEEYKTLKDKAIEMELTDAKKELFALLGEFASKTFSKKKEDSSLINFGLYKYESKSKEDTKDDEPDYVKQWCK